MLATPLPSNGETTAPAATTPIKMERRDSNTSESSLEHLDLGRTPKKLNTATSTPMVVGGEKSQITEAKRDSERYAHCSRLQQPDSDEANDYDDEESADEKASAPAPRLQAHHKRRLGARSLLDKRTSVHIEHNPDNPNSLRKKFRFNRTSLDCGNESGFVDASNSQLLNSSSAPGSVPALMNGLSNGGSKSNSSSAASTPPHLPSNGGNSSADSAAGEDMKYVCPICEVVSATPHQFTNHIRCHNYNSGNSENFTCRICSKVLSSASSLDRHVLVHTGERPFNCKYCHLTFTTNGNMHRHMRTHKQHQHTHHRRNSSGAKFGKSGSAAAALALANGPAAAAAPHAVASAAAAMATAMAAAAAAAGEADNHSATPTAAAANAMPAGANDKRFNGKHAAAPAAEGYDSDGGCSSDSTAGHNNNNNNNHNHNNNNNDINTNNNNYKRKPGDEDDQEQARPEQLLKQRLQLASARPVQPANTPNTTNTREGAASPNGEPLMCPVCNEDEFVDLSALDQHMDAKHPGIPAKCKHCEVIFRSHHQLGMHPCTADIKPQGELERLCLKSRRSSIALQAEEEARLAAEEYRRNELFNQLELKSLMARSSSPAASHHNMELAEDDIKSEPSAGHDSKDLADIQSILNMTSSSNTSNFLKNFEQSVNTPSSQFSYDRDEEEAQDAFTAEFRKMKVRGEFPCKLCTAVFPNLRALKGHNRFHLTEVGPAGPFRCNMCPYSICDKAALVRHMRTHNGDRPYECAVCNYAFTTKANCERHLRNRHAKTTRDEVKRAIIYHPSEDSSCDDPAKKLHLFSSPELDDDADYYHQPQPKDRSTPVSHLKEMLTAGENFSAKPVKIQVKNLNELLDKSTASSGYHDSYDKHHTESSAAPIDMSMDVLDLSKKPMAQNAQKPEEPKAGKQLPNAQLDKSIADLATKGTSSSADEPNLDLLEKQQQLFLAQQPWLSEQYLQQMYRNILFPQLNPFLMPNSPFLPNNLNDMQKLLRTMLMASGVPLPPSDLDKLANAAPAPAMPPMSPMMSDKSSAASMASLASPQDMLSPSTNHLNIPRQVGNASVAQQQPPPHLPPSMLPNGPVKMVLKNGVFMPKQKQRRYRTERPFACEHCSARFTLRSNMERHVKQQHPQFYAQRQRSGHHVMRGRGASSAANLNGISHLQAAVAAQAQAHYAPSANALGGPSPISDQVKYAILAQQLKARKDPDLLQQALVHGSNSVNNAAAGLFSMPGAAGHLSNGPPSAPAFPNFLPPHLSQNGTPNGSMEDDEPKLVIDEDDEEEEEDEDVHDDDHEDDDDLDIQLMEQSHELDAEEQQEEEEQDKGEEDSKVPTTVNDVERKSEDKKEAAKKVAESILEQAIKAGQSQSPKPDAMKSMIAQAPAVGKFLKDVASSTFKDDSQDLVPVSKLVDNATSNSVTFNNYFRPSDVANHMDQSDEEGLVASGSASESNNSGAEDGAGSHQPKKKSAYSLAPNRVACPYCQRMFPWSSSLRRHILTHTGQKPFKCSHCPLLFTTKSNCDRHLLRKHGNVESAVSVYVPTEDVNEPIPLPKSVEEIERMQRERDEEERRRKAEEQRERLEKEQREKEKLELERSQQQQRALLKQLAAVQFTSLQQKGECAAGGISSSDLPYKCHLCESSFGERNQCLDHIKGYHAQEFDLLLAKGAVDSETDMAQVHSNEEEERSRDEAKGGKYPDYSNRKVICAFCLRRFWSTEDLRRHMRTHSGERPFQCEICLRKFTLKHSMLRHMKKHNGQHLNGGSGAIDGLVNGNSCSDYSDDEMGHTPPMAPIGKTSSLNALLIGSKIQELLSKSNDWAPAAGQSVLRERKQNTADEAATAAAGNGPSDIIGNLLGISDQGFLNKLMSSPDEAAKLLGVEK